MPAPTYRLLMVEDSADDAELLLYSLNGGGLTVSAVRVETEPEFVRELDAGLPDIILCDYNLPRFSARRVLEIVRERALDVPIIVVSHHIGEDAAVEAIQQGASDYLLKNRLGRLPRAIEAAIGRRAANREKAEAETALRKSESITHSVLNSLNMRIAVLDAAGVIVATNKAWTNFETVRTEIGAGPAGVGANYLDMLRKQAERGNAYAVEAMQLASDVIERRRNFASIEYEIPTAGGVRWHVARAMPLEGSEHGAVISHEDITDRMLTHIALRDAHNNMKRLSARVLTIQEDERRNIARELHDDIGQSMTALKISLHRLAGRTAADQQRLLGECLNVADAILERLRQLLQELRPPQLDQLGLEEALQWLLEMQRGATGVMIEFNFSSRLERRLPAALESTAYRIVQEALNNATRHGKATHIAVNVDISDSLLRLAIRDDGSGFDEEAARARAMKAGSMGLIGMQERAELAGGRLKLRTTPGSGTTVSVTFPLNQPAALQQPPEGN